MTTANRIESRAPESVGGSTVTGARGYAARSPSGPHSLDAYLELLKRDGVLCHVGVPERPHPSPSIMSILAKRRTLTGSGIGGIAETQEMLDFCADNGIVSDVELIPIQQINEAYRRMARGDVKYRFVIDMASLKEE